MPQKRILKKILLIMDSVAKLDPRWDNSMALARELTRRGIQCWIADIPEIRLERGTVWVRSDLLTFSEKNRVRSTDAQDTPIEAFDIALIRKEPPLNMAYYTLTLILEHAKIPIVNDPRGIREANEKMWGLRFARLMPETLISSSPRDLIRFGRQFAEGFVIKPLNEKGGKGVFKVERVTPAIQNKITAASKDGSEALVCQRFLKKSGGIDKRIVILDGNILCAFEKHPSKKDFRANLGLGATAHPTKLTSEEIKLAQSLAKPLQQAGLFLAGLDVMGEKLLEVNVTSPAGMTDAESLYPGGNFIAAWADWLELFLRRPRVRQQNLPR